MTHPKVAIITGAGSGIGAATAKRFAKDGYAVVLNGRTKEKLEKIAAEIDSENVLIQSGDVSKEQDVKDLIENTIKEFSQIDTLVNNAAIAKFETIENLSLEDWNKQLSINVSGPFLVTKYALPHLKKTKGSIINVSSVSGIGGDWGGFAYNTTKGALNLMTKGLALDLGSQGVRINAVAPSLTRTDMAEFVLQDENTMKKFKSRNPMKRAAEPEEIASAIAFLASDDAAFVNGAILTTDGGVTASNGQPNMSD